MSPVPALTVRSLRATSVRVPMRRPLGTSALRVTHAPFLIVDLETEEGVTGRAYAFLYVDRAAAAVRSLLAVLEEAVSGKTVAPLDLAALAARRFRLLGLDGSARAAAALVDVAAWDALSRAAGLPLARFLGGDPRPMPAYDSSGLGLRADPGTVAAEAVEMTDAGFRAVKLRLGHPDLTEDLAAFKAVRRAVPEATEIMVDYNQALSRPEAIKRGRALAAEGASWLEEPLPHEDLTGHWWLRASLAGSLPLQIGENFTHPMALLRALTNDAADLVMPDLERIGGVTGWMQAAGITAAVNVPMSSHLYPEVSAQLLCATTTSHWLEWVDWAEPLLQTPLEVKGGMALTPSSPGNGLDWDLDAVQKYAVD